MSVLQAEDLVSYQLRTAYLTELADGVGERLITLNESIVNSAPFKAAGWRANPGLIKRTHSPPIPTAVASEYFRAPRSLGFTLEDDADGGMGGGGLLGGPDAGGGLGGFGAGGGGGGSVISGGGGIGPDTISMRAAATKRRRRREQLEEDDDSSDLSDESDDDGSAEQRAAQQIKFAKMPIRHRSGSSPLQSSNLRNPPIGPSGTYGSASVMSSPGRPGPRRGSQSALEVVKERTRRDTVTSSEVSSENELDASGFHRPRGERDAATVAATAAATAAAAAAAGGSSAAGAAAGAAATAASASASARGSARARARMLSTSSSNNSSTSSAGVKTANAAATLRRQESDLLEDEREDDDDDDDDEGEDSDDDDESEGSDLSSTFGGSIGFSGVGDNPLNPSPPATDGPIVGTPPRGFTRTSTVRRSQHPAHLLQPVGGALPPPRPMSTMRPVSTAPPRSLLTAALKAKAPSAMPFDRFASLSGQGEQNPVMVRIYVPASQQPGKPFEVAIRRSVHEDQRSADRPVTVADLIGLSLWRYTEEKRAPAVPPNRRSLNWWTLRMVEEGGEVDDDFPPLERTRALVSFTTANNNKGGMRFRSNSKVYDDFALVAASPAEFAENQAATPQFDEAETASAHHSDGEDTAGGGAPLDANDDGERTPRNATPQPGAVSSGVGTGLGRLRLGDRQLAPLDQPRMNPILTTTYRRDVPHADEPAPAAAPNTTRGRKKLLRVHIHSIDAAPGQMVTVDVTTDTYLEEVLDIVCKKRHLDKGSHVLKLPGSGVVVLTDREVSSIGNVADLDLYRKRFATDAPGAASGGYSPGSGGSPKLSFDGLVGGGGGGNGAAATAAATAASRRFRKAAAVAAGGGGGVGGVGGVGGSYGTTPGAHLHPLAREALRANTLVGGDVVNDASYKKYTVWRRQGLKLMGSSERILTIDGEYVHIMHASAASGMAGAGAATGKITTVHFSNVVGCKVSLRHPTHFKLIVYKATESKRYDFEAKSADEALEIVGELKKAMSPYQDS